MQNTDDKRPLLLENRPVQTQFMPQPLDLCDRCAFAEHLGHRVTGNQMNQGKYERYDNPDYRDRQKETAQYKGEHKNEV